MQLAWSGEAWIGQADWLEPGAPARPQRCRLAVDQAMNTDIFETMERWVGGRPRIRVGAGGGAPGSQSGKY
jgi:hypothetical protein